MPEQLLTVLKICLLVLLYLFFLRVLRAVWAEVRGPALAGEQQQAVVAPAPTKGRPRGSRASKRSALPTKLFVVEPPERANAEFPIGPEVTIGRSAGCSIVFDEQYISSVHTRVFTREDQVFVEDLGSTNGTWINGVRAVGQMPVRAGDRVQIGNVILELR
ncbi:MAG: FHA domain-containing protein [Microthrixaceae bacterium]